jgi:hypothetical protein
MASNHVATAQGIIWGQFQEHRPAYLMEAISEHCQLAVADKETISQSVMNLNSRSRGMSI